VLQPRKKAAEIDVKSASFGRAALAETLISPRFAIGERAKNCGLLEANVGPRGACQKCVACHC